MVRLPFLFPRTPLATEQDAHLKIYGSLSLQTQHPCIQRRCTTALYKLLPGSWQEARGAGSRPQFGVYYRLGCLFTAQRVHHSALIEANIFSPTFTFHSSQKAWKINIQATSKVSFCIVMNRECWQRNKEPLASMQVAQESRNKQSA